MRLIFLILFAQIALLADAQVMVIERCKFGQPLLDALVDGHSPDSTLGYSRARDILYSEIDNVGNNLSGIYTNFTVTLDPNDDPTNSAYQNGQGINAEHVFPQSLGAGNEPMRSDLHNIFPSRAFVNTVRGSCPFGEINDNDTESWFYLEDELNFIPNSNIDFYSEKDAEDCTFEPRESVKGDIARAMFYFYTIYNNVADDDFFEPQMEVLFAWHELDPVDDKELDRTVEIGNRQGNRNPFVIDSSLVRRAYFEADASYPNGDINCYQGTISNTQVEDSNWVKLQSNIIEDEVIILSDENLESVQILDILGHKIQSQSKGKIKSFRILKL